MVGDPLKSKFISWLNVCFLSLESKSLRSEETGAPEGSFIRWVHIGEPWSPLCSHDPPGRPTSALSRGLSVSAPSQLGEHSCWQRLDFAAKSRLGNLQGGRFLVEETFLKCKQYFGWEFFFYWRKIRRVHWHPQCNDFISNPYHRPHCAGPRKCKLCVDSNTHSHAAEAHFSLYSVVELSLGYGQESHYGLAFTNLYIFPWRKALAVQFSFIYLRCCVWTWPACLEARRTWENVCILTKSQSTSHQFRHGQLGTIFCS